MKKITFLLSMLTIFAIYTNGQNEKEFQNPDEQIIVNKEYDEDGNLIAFDSTYIHQWSSDTVQELFKDDLFGGNMIPDIEKLMESFIGDSAFHRFSIPDPFIDENLFKRFERSLPDSAFMRDFGFHVDSIPFGQEFIMPDMKELQKQMEEHFRGFGFPEPMMKEKLTDKQKKELDELMKKHQKEMEGLPKKWEENK